MQICCGRKIVKSKDTLIGMAIFVVGIIIIN